MTMKECCCAPTLDASMDGERYAILSGDNRKVLRRKRRLLARSINPAGHLMAACQSFGVFTNTEVEIFNSEKGNWNRQVKLMIKILKRKPSSAFHGFKRALIETQQSHIADVLRGKDENLMSDFHQRVLRYCRNTLVKNVILEGELLHALISTETITHADADLIRAEKGKWKRQVDVLVNCLLRRPDTAFIRFIEALLLCNQQHIANTLLDGGLEVTVRLNLKRRRSDDDDLESSSSSESPEVPDGDDIRTLMNRLLEDGLHNIEELLEARRCGKRRKMADPGDLKLEYVEKLVGLLQHFSREVLSVELGSIVVRILCLSRVSLWDLRDTCRSEVFLSVCRSALISTDLQSVIDVEVSVDEGSFHRCLDNLDEIFPPPPSPLSSGAANPLPPELLHLILHEALAAREVGIDVRPERLSKVCETWNTVLNSDRFIRDHRRFIEASMKPYLFAPVRLKTRILSSSEKPKATVGVCILERLLYVARAETSFIEVFSIPDISSTTDLRIVPDHVLVRTLSVPLLEMPFNMAASPQSRCLYLTDFSQNVGCVWRVTPDGAVTKFAADVGRPIGISISRDNYVIVVSETPNCLYVFSRFGERVHEISLLDFEAPRQAICLEPGRFALIHGYLEPDNRIVELDSSGHVMRCYGSTIGTGSTQIHWPAALIHDSRGRMMVGDRENRRVHLIQTDFRLRRHLVQLDRTSVARPRRLCIDYLNGTLYIGQTDPTVKVFRIAHPCQETSPDHGDLLVNCFGAPKKAEDKTKQASPDGEGKTDSSESEAGCEKKKFVLPPGEYRRTEYLNELPVPFLQTIFLKAVALHRPRKALRRNLAGVCSKWKNIVTVLHFSNRLTPLVREVTAAAKRRKLEALESQLNSSIE